MTIKTEKTCNYESITRASGAFDVLILLPFLLPGVSSYTMELLASLHLLLGLAENFTVFEPIHLLFVNLMALVSIMWGVLRYRNPLATYGNIDSFIRLIIASFMAYYLLVESISPIIWPFVFSEIIWAVLQICKSEMMAFGKSKVN